MMTVIMHAELNESRARMIVSATMLLREQGLTGTSLGDVLEHSGAPRGSIYHHFPGGKAELVEEAVRFAGGYVGSTLERVAADEDPVSAMLHFIETWRRILNSSDFRAGCPVVAVAVEAQDDSPQLTRAVAEVFAAWHDILAALLTRSGVDRPRAARLATLTVAAVEGAVVLCRAQRDTTALDDISVELGSLLTTAVA